MLRNNLPTLTSDIVSYKNVYEEIGIDFTCKNSNEWFEKINNLINDKYLIEDFTKRSSKLIKDNYSENKFILQWDNLLNNL
jgi:glycosyltransferase involved in cell wall biosynthesis